MDITPILTLNKMPLEKQKQRIIFTISRNIHILLLTRITELMPGIKMQIKQCVIPQTSLFRAKKLGKKYYEETRT